MSINDFAARLCQSAAAEGRNTLLEPELRVFFADDWPDLSEDERELLRDFVRMLKTRLKRRQSQAGETAGYAPELK